MLSSRPFNTWGGLTVGSWKVVRLSSTSFPPLPADGLLGVFSVRCYANSYVQKRVLPSTFPNLILVKLFTLPD